MNTFQKNICLYLVGVSFSCFLEPNPDATSKTYYVDKWKPFEVIQPNFRIRK